MNCGVVDGDAEAEALHVVNVSDIFEQEETTNPRGGSRRLR
jgi:hypothetical protein